MATTIMKNIVSSDLKITDYYSYKQSLLNTNDSNQETSHEYRLKTNNFNPTKFSPNLFMTKLEFRMKHYYLEEELHSDALKL